MERAAERNESGEQRRGLGIVISRFCAQIPPNKIARLDILHGEQSQRAEGR
jgi:hypothetical protein